MDIALLKTLIEDLIKLNDDAIKKFDDKTMTDEDFSQFMNQFGEKFALVAKEADVPFEKWR